MSPVALFIPVALYIIFMGAAFVPPFDKYLDYERAMVRAVIWYAFGILLTSFFLFEMQVSLASLLYLMVAFIIVWFPTLRFATWWQEHGRPNMAPTKFTEKSMVTFYDFTPRYSFVKLF